jgi:hypothetical protein
VQMSRMFGRFAEVMLNAPGITKGTLVAGYLAVIWLARG